MLWAARIIGAIVAFTFGVILTEIILANSGFGDWTNVVPFVLAVVGWMIGSEVARRLAARPAKS